MIKVGLLGAGMIAGVHAQAYKNLQDLCQVVAVADVRLDRARQLAEKLGAEAMDDAEKVIALDEIDMVDICLPTFLHSRYAVKAAQAGVHILCEKPMALTEEQAEQMIQAADQSGVALMIAQVIRFWPEYKAIKEIIDSGELGEALMVSGERTGTTPMYSWEDWLLDEARSGGAVLDLHIHDLDFAAYLLGEPKTVSAVGVVNEWGVSHLCTSVQFANGKTASLIGGWMMPQGYPFTMQLSVLCEKGTLEFNSRAGANIEKRDEAGSFITVYGRGSDPERVPVDKVDAYYSEIKYFVECLQAGRKPDVVTPASAKRSVKMALAARESVKNGGVITL